MDRVTMKSDKVYTGTIIGEYTTALEMVGEGGYQRYWLVKREITQIERDVKVLSQVTCTVCHKEISAANGIFVHTDTGRPESMNNGFHYARARNPK